MAPFNEPVLACPVGVLGAAGRQAEALSVLRRVRGQLLDVQSYGRLVWGLQQWDIGNTGEAYRSFTEADVATDGTVAPGGETPLRGDGLTIREGSFIRAVMTALLGDVDAALAFVDASAPRGPVRGLGPGLLRDHDRFHGRGRRNGTASGGPPQALPVCAPRGTTTSGRDGAGQAPSPARTRPGRRPRRRNSWSPTCSIRRSGASPTTTA